jgi:hypothetical protein
MIPVDSGLTLLAGEGRAYLTAWDLPRAVEQRQQTPFVVPMRCGRLTTKRL